MKRRRIGEQTACANCGQDIEWHGKTHGWRDRGNGTEYLPYVERGEIVHPIQGEHSPKKRSGWRARRRCPFAACSSRRAFGSTGALDRHLTNYHGIFAAEIANDAWGLSDHPFGGM